MLCDTYQQAVQPEQPAPAHSSNTRSPCASVMESAASSAPIFSVEQQYTLVDPRSQWPLGESRALPAFRCWQDAAAEGSCRVTKACRAAFRRLWLLQGWPEQPTGELTSSFCAVGSGAVHGRTFASTHSAACVRARLAVTGTGPPQPGWLELM